MTRKPFSFIRALGLVLVLGFSLSTAFAATRVWDGSTSGNWATAANWVGGIAPQPGDRLEFPTNATRYVTTNNFPAQTEFTAAAIYGAGYTMRGNAMRLTGDGLIGQVIFLSTPNGNCTWEADVTLTGTNRWIYIVTANSATGTLFLRGDIAIGEHYFIFEVEAQDIDMSGAISTAEPDSYVMIRGDGSLTFSGSAINNYPGTTRVVESAQLVLNRTSVNGAVPANLSVISGSVRWLRPQQVANDAVVSVASASLELNGFTESIGEITVFSSMVDLGGGTLTLASNLYGNSAQLIGGGQLQLTFGTHEFEIDGTTIMETEISGLASIVKTGEGELHDRIDPPVHNGWNVTIGTFHPYVPGARVVSGKLLAEPCAACRS